MKKIKGALNKLISKQLSIQNFNSLYGSVEMQDTFITDIKDLCSDEIPINLFKNELIRRDPNNPFIPIYNYETRYNILTGGRGSAKTTNVITFALLYTYSKNVGVLFTRYTKVSMQVSTIPEVQAIMYRLHEEGLLDYRDFTVTNNSIVNKITNSKIQFFGLKSNSKAETARLKSLSSSFNIWVIEEGEDFTDWKAFTDIDNSIRTIDKRNQVFWILNPSNRNHPLFTEFIETGSCITVEGINIPVSNRIDTLHIHTTYKYPARKGWLDDSWLIKKEKVRLKLLRDVENLRKNYVGDDIETKVLNLIYMSEYYIEYLGGWKLRSELTIYGNWVKGDMDESLPSVYGLDFGYFPDPLAMVEVRLDRKRERIYLKEICYATKIVDVPDYINRLGVKRGSIIVADTNEPTTFVQIKRSGYNMKKARKGAGSIVTGIKRLLKYELVVCDNSPNLVKELNRYEWLDNKTDIPRDEFNHLLDATRYAVNYLLKK